VTGLRLSADIDISQDSEQRLAAQADAKGLTEAGFKLSWKKSGPSTRPTCSGASAPELKTRNDSSAAFPAIAVGVVFLDTGKPVQPDFGALAKYQRQAGSLGSVWPSSPQISSAMVERYNTKPNGNEPKP